MNGNRKPMRLLHLHLLVPGGDGVPEVIVWDGGVYRHCVRVVGQRGGPGRGAVGGAAVIGPHGQGGGVQGGVGGAGAGVGWENILVFRLQN